MYIIILSGVNIPIRFVGKFHNIFLLFKGIIMDRSIKIISTQYNQDTIWLKCNFPPGFSKFSVEKMTFRGKKQNTDIPYSNPRETLHNVCFSWNVLVSIFIIMTVNVNIKYYLDSQYFKQMFMFFIYCLKVNSCALSSFTLHCCLFKQMVT